jgi:hypothetical protein
VLAKRVGLPVSSQKALNPDSDSDSDSDDETSRSLEFEPLFWRIILADQWQGVRLKKGNVVEIPGVGTIPPISSFAMDVGDPKEHIHRIVKELSEVKSAVASLRTRLRSNGVHFSPQKGTLASRQLTAVKGTLCSRSLVAMFLFSLGKLRKATCFLANGE